MKRIFLPALGLALLLVGVFLYSENTVPSAFEVHIRNAHTALARVETFARDGTLSGGSDVSFFASAYASENDEFMVAELVATVRSETAAALGAILLMTDSEVKVNALAEIVALQEKTLEIVSDALLRLQNTAVIDEIALSLEATADENVQVEVERGHVLVKSKGRAGAKLEGESDDEEIAPDSNTEAAGETALMMPTESDSKEDTSHDQQEVKLQEALDLASDLDISEEYPANVRKKWAILNDILTECTDQNESEKCQAGKAKGLAIALNAKVRQELRAQNERTWRENRDESEEQQEDEDESDEDDDGPRKSGSSREEDQDRDDDDSDHGQESSVESSTSVSNEADVSVPTFSDDADEDEDDSEIEVEFDGSSGGRLNLGR